MVLEEGAHWSASSVTVGFVSDDVVFTKGAFDALVAGPQLGRSVKAVATSSEVPVAAAEPVEAVAAEPVAAEPVAAEPVAQPTATEEADQ